MQESKNIDLTALPDLGLDRIAPSHKTVLLALGAVAVIYLAGVTSSWWPTPDSAMYLALGRSMAQGEGFRSNGEFGPLIQPGFPWILATLYSLFGSGFWAPNLFEALCGIASVCLIYLTLARLGGKTLALLAAVMTGLSHSFYLNSHEVLTDMPGVAAFWAMAYAMLRAQKGAWLWLAPAALLAAILAFLRVPDMLAVFALAVAVAIDPAGGRRLTRLIRAAVPLAAGGAALAVLYFWGRSLTAATLAYTPILQKGHFDVGVLANNLLKTLSDTMTGQRSWVIGLVGLALMLAGIVSRWRRGTRLSIVALLYCLTVYCVTGGWAVEPRYWLPVQGFAIYAMLQGLLWGVWQVCRWREKFASPKVFHTAALVLAAIVVAFNIPQVALLATYYPYLSHIGQSRYYDKIRDGDFRDLYPVADILKQRVGPGETVAVCGNTSKALHYLSGRRVVQLETATQEDAARLAPLLDSDRRIRLVVLEMEKDKDAAKPSFANKLKEQLRQIEQEGKLKLIFPGRRCLVFQRTLAGDKIEPPETKPAHANAGKENEQ